jgi:serine/threonine-protein kinase RsbW/stage II sporulation protein AB (anti-sigma F factor)
MTTTCEPFEQTWPAVAESVPKARRAVGAYLDGATTPDPPRNDVVLVVSEAVTNAVVHAYRDAEPGEVHVSVELKDREVELVVQDDGVGMVPRPDSPGIGLGLPLIATLSHRFDTRTTPGGGTRICAWFSLHPDDATLED